MRISPKSVLTGFLIVFWLASAIRLGADMVHQPEPDATHLSTTKEGVSIYYFHGNFRCPSCNYLERVTQKTVLDNYQKELDSDELHWAIVNTDLRENLHFKERYELFTQSVILADNRDAENKRWKNLGQIWQFINDEPGLTHYLKQEIDGYLAND